MCMKDIIHYRRYATVNAAGAVVAGIFTSVMGADSRRLSITISSAKACGFASGERTILHFGSADLAVGNFQVLTKEQPSVTLRLADFGSSILGPIYATTNAAADDIINVSALVTNEDDYTMTHSP